MTITSWDGMISAWTGGSGSLGTRYGQRVYFHKANEGAAAPYTPHSLWRADGFPGTGTLPPVGLGNGRVCNRSDGIGGIPFYLPPSGSGLTNYVVGVSCGNTSALTNFFIFDRVSDVRVALTGSGSITGLDATSRLQSGEGAQIWIENATALGTATTFNLTYVNQDGVTRTTPNLASQASAANHDNVLVTRLFMPLAADDMGARSVTAINNAGGSGTGDIVICLVRLVAMIQSVSLANINEYETILHHGQCVRLYDESCLMCVWYNSGGVITTTFVGEMKVLAA